MRVITQDNAGLSIFVAFLLIPLSGLATDIYLPSLPAMSTAMGTSPAQIQFSLTIFLVGYAIGQLFIGNIMDCFGRYRLGLFALFLFGASCIGIIFCHSILILNTLRLVQGLLAAVAVVAKRTYFVDVFSGDRLEHYLSSFTIVWSMGPIVAPFIGGYLQNSFGWQANFIFLAGFAWIALLLELWVSGETLKHPQAFEPRNTLRQYREMLSHGPFIRGLVNLSLPYSAIMAYSMAAPFIIEHVYHMDSKTTGYASLAMGLAWMVGGFVAKSQHHRTTSYKHGKAVQVMFAMVLIMLSTSFYISNIYTLVLFAFVIHATCGMLFNIYFTECLSMFPRQAGLSGGLTGGVAFMLTSILSYGAITVFSVNIQLRLAVVYLVFAGLSALMLRWKTVYRCDVDVARNEVNRVSVELS